MYNCSQNNNKLHVNMFIDYLDMYQDHDNVDFPQLSDTKIIVFDTTTGDSITEKQPPFQFEGSYSTRITIRINNGRIYVSGNPSRFNRLDNLYGLTSIDKAVSIYNTILISLGLPPFTKSTGLKYLSSKGDKFSVFSDGAVFTRVDVTSNIATGHLNALDYIKAVSTLPYRHLVPHLYSDGNTTEWRNHRNKVSSLIHAKLYYKAKAIETFDLPKIKRLFGEDSDEYLYIKKLYDFCVDTGIVRFEQEFKSRFFRNNPHLRYYGLLKLSHFKPLHSEFLNITNKLQVTSMSLESIADKLLRLDICHSTKSANTTAMYALLWMNGKTFESDKRQVQLHRARLRKIGIDIFHSCDLSKQSLVLVRKAREVNESVPVPPAWYRPASHLKLVA